MSDYCTTSQPDAGLAYFYFDFNDEEKRQPSLLIRSIMFQLCLRHKASWIELQKLYDSCSNTTMPLRDEVITGLIDRTIDQLPRTYIILDALDECRDREDLLDFVTTISAGHRSTLHLLVTSRECDITKRMLDFGALRIDMREEVVDEDIFAYINHHLEKDERLRMWDQVPSAYDNIRDGLMAKAKGM